jgi:hypothetical protein
MGTGGSDLHTTEQRCQGSNALVHYKNHVTSTYVYVPPVGISPIKNHVTSTYTNVPQVGISNIFRGESQPKHILLETALHTPCKLPLSHLLYVQSPAHILISRSLDRNRSSILECSLASQEPRLLYSGSTVPDADTSEILELRVEKILIREPILVSSARSN